MSELTIAACILAGGVFVWLVLKAITQVLDSRIGGQRLRLKTMEVETEELEEKRRMKEAEVDLDRSLLYTEEAVAELKQEIEERDRTIQNLRHKIEERGKTIRRGTKEGVPEKRLPGGTETMLLVENESLSRDVGQVILKHLGYTVLTARNGREALDVYHAHQDEIALVLTDMGIPKMGGKELYEALVRINPKVKVVLVRGDSVQQSEDELRGLGLKGFVQKPFQPSGLARVVREVLDDRYRGSSPGQGGTQDEG